MSQTSYQFNFSAHKVFSLPPAFCQKIRFFLQGFIFEESVKKIDYIDYRIKADNTALESAEV